MRPSRNTRWAWVGHIGKRSPRPALFVVSDDRSMTGQNLQINGGLTLRAQPATRLRSARRSALQWPRSRLRAEPNAIS